jgi:copper chaperone CopZ
MVMDEKEATMTKTLKRSVAYEMFVVSNIHCVRCAETLRNTVADHPGVWRVESDATTGWTQVDYDPDVVSSDELLDAIKFGGYQLDGTRN